MTRRTGTYRITSTDGEPVRAFLPHPLPPAHPPLVVEGSLAKLHAAAADAVERLAVVSALVPSTEWFLYGFVRKEAVISSQIEGTQATLRDVAAFEATDRSDCLADVEEVCNYVEALKYARREMARPRGLPLSARLLCGAHRRLMKGVRGKDKHPGEVRRSQNWVGGTRPGNARFVPPPHDVVGGMLADLDRWIHGTDPLPPLVRAGLAHVQFETIHPFLDGNGRIGRLLVALLVEHWKLLPAPVLYLSLALKRHQREYYIRLSAVRTDGDWEGWTAFYLECVREAAENGIVVAQRVFNILDGDRSRIAAHPRSTVAAIRLFDTLPSHPMMTVRRAVKLLRTTKPTAAKALNILCAAGILWETTGKRRDRVYAYHRYLQALTDGEE